MSDDAGQMSEPMPKPHGAQVVLTGEAQAAARGELHGEIHHNVTARDAAMGAVPEPDPEPEPEPVPSAPEPDPEANIIDTPLDD